IASGDLPRGWTDSGRRDQTVFAGSFLSGHQGAGRHCAGRPGGDVRIVAHGYVSHSVPSLGDASGEADSDGGTDATGHGSAVGTGTESTGRLVLSIRRQILAS